MWKKSLVTFKIKNVLYISMSFTWLLKEAREVAKSHKGKVVIGGPGAILMKDKIDFAEYRESTCYNVLAMHNPLATFTSRGCVRNCPFCAVPRIEGEFRELNSWIPAPIVCDNNIFACSKSHFKRVIESIAQFDYIDFNQGLDARLLKDYHIEEFKKLKGIKIRFAFDHIGIESKVHDAIELCRKNGFKDFGIYVLIGFNDTPEEARYKLEKVRQWGIFPNPMRYQPLDIEKKNSFLSDKWSEEEMSAVVRYYSRLVYLDHVPFEEYIYGTKNKQKLDDKRRGFGLF